MDLRTTNILVTGGVGYIGAKIVEQLLEQKFTYVRVLDNLSTGNKSNLTHLVQQYDNLEFMYGDVSNLETCRKALKYIDAVCHQASLAPHHKSLEDPISSHNNVVNGFLNILTAAKEKGIKRVVYAGYNLLEDNLTYPYIANNKINDLYAKTFVDCYGMECIGVKYLKELDPSTSYSSNYRSPEYVNKIVRKNIELLQDHDYRLFGGSVVVDLE